MSRAVSAAGLLGLAYSRSLFRQLILVALCQNISNGRLVHTVLLSIGPTCTPVPCIQQNIPVQSTGNEYMYPPAHSAKYSSQLDRTAAADLGPYNSYSSARYYRYYRCTRYDMMWLAAPDHGHKRNNEGLMIQMPHARYHIGAIPYLGVEEIAPCAIALRVIDPGA